MTRLLTHRAVHGWFLCAGLATLSALPAARADQFFAAGSSNYLPGDPRQGTFSNPALAYGAPRGGGDSVGGLHVLNLGVGGQITFNFDVPGETRTIRNDDGADFIVFENAIYPAGDSSQTFAELMYVEVSSDGTNFARFPTLSLTAGAVAPEGTINPANVSGFAGVHPVLANSQTNSIDPFDPATAGGDAFDLSLLENAPLVLSGQVDLDAIRYLRLIDVVGGVDLDSAGHVIFDAAGTGNGGADVDAIAVIHGVSTLPEPTAPLLAIVGGVGLLRRRRRR